MHHAVNHGTLQRSPIALERRTSANTSRENAILEADARSIRFKVSAEAGSDG